MYTNYCNRTSHELVSGRCNRPSHYFFYMSVLVWLLNFILYDTNPLERCGYTGNWFRLCIQSVEYTLHTMPYARINP